MSGITAWEARARSIGNWRQPEEQRVIGVIVSLLQGKTAPSDAAKALDGGDGVGFLWLILCDAIRHLGSSRHNSELLVKLLNGLASPSASMDTTSEQRDEVAFTTGRKLPQEWHVTFRDYGNCR